METKNDLFEEKGDKGNIRAAGDMPLAARMRPRLLEEFVGQKHILGEGKLLRRLIDSDRIASLILYGAPGTGKSALASVISSLTKSKFDSIHAASAGVKEVKALLEAAKKRKESTGKKTILFIDEIHRFSKSQQDILIHDVEHGNVVLIGATTHNPFFYIIPALISRSHVFEFRPHLEDDIVFILNRALRDTLRGMGTVPVVAEAEAVAHIARVSDGDARRALNALEVGILTTPPQSDGKIYFTKAVAEESIQKKIVRYDRDGDDHYDAISAFIKSMRGTDPDAALYWLAKMLYAGEEPRFIARRIIICAAEDVGNADPQALVVANAALQAAEFVGMPEARILLAQAAVYVACAPKSNASYMGLEKAAADVNNESAEEVPEHLKDASYQGAKILGHGQDYEYAHKGPEHYVKQEYVKKNRKYYYPTDLGYEKRIAEWLEHLKKE
ncbi:MAG: replication-associated recombination protein A [Candidatus Omnitrophica bacterium]|nr:replication-associated recombination protein A [Candidatus Omnitrophota bacterium]MBU4478957.1 replication-associated recombination protein A [Candidatus Omnitrophota bacterium]MCG2703900.1 replication-associated recombination protein A [Candidatus Omnitrophota bacterium]